MKKYRKNHTARIPARADAALRHESARSGAEVLYWHLVQNMLVQRERRNDLPELTPQRAQELFEAWRRGEMADVQLMWDQLEERDDTLMVVLNARLSALAEMPWAVVPDADAVGDDPQRQALAEEQKRVLMSLFTAVENLEDALVHLGMADFRGVAALEIVGDLRGAIDDLRIADNGEPTLAGASGANATATARALGAAPPASKCSLRWEVIEPWNLCRPVRRGPWLYNAEASATPTRLEAFVPGSVIIREAMPIDLPAMYLISSLHHSVHSWDGFLEVFGIPNIFMEMPPATPQDKAQEFDAVVQRLIGEGRGTVPNGAKFHTVETSKDNSQSFEARYKVCREAIITLATGGLLTVGTAPNSGTLAGNAHSDSFSRLCAASARGISSAINRQFVRRVLAEAFPGQPMLVQFELAPEPVDDRKQMAELLSALNAAGWAPSAETVSEMMNFEVQRTQQPPTAPNTQVPPVMNRGDAPGFESPSGRFLRRGDSASEEEDSVESPAESEPPLNEGELEALRLLGAGLNPAQVAADAEYMAEAMKEDLRLTNDDLRVEHSAAAPQEEEEVVANSCNQYEHEEGCDGADDDPSSPDDYAEAEEDERREREMDASSMESAGYTPEEIERVTGIKISDDEEIVTNASCNQHQHATGCMRFAVLKKNKGGRSSGGKKMLGKTGSPNLLEAGDSKRKTKRALVKAFDKAKDGKKVSTGYKMGSHEVTLAPGDKEHWGTHHAERKEHPKKISSDKLAEVTLHGKRENDRGNDVAMEHKGVRLVMTPEKQPTKKTDEPLIPKKNNDRIVGKNWYEPRK